MPFSNTFCFESKVKLCFYFMIQAGWCGSKLKCLMKSFIVNAYEGNQCETVVVQRLPDSGWSLL